MMLMMMLMFLIQGLLWSESAMEKETLLELSHLTEAEQTIILNVLFRDNELRNHDEGRIRCVWVVWFKINDLKW